MAHLSKTIVPLAAAGALVGAVLAPSAASAEPAGPAFASAAEATIHPGIQTDTDGAQCTANFVFSDGVDVFIGQAAHCSGLGAATDTNGCTAGSLPADGTVEVDLGSSGVTGTLVYSSWVTMQEVGETDPNTCAYNDFSLIKVPADAIDEVNPSIPHWGGPTGVDVDGLGFGESMYSYGNSSLRFGLTVLSPKQGLSLGTTGGGWTHPVYTVTPGVPGDSGSAMVDSRGRAAGVLSTLSIAPTTGSNNFSDLHLALEYMQANVAALADVELVEGDVAFQPGALPIGI